MSLSNQSIIKHKMGLLNLAEELHNVSQAYRVMGVSRDTFYRAKEAKESGGLDALLHKNRRRANLSSLSDFRRISATAASHTFRSSPPDSLHADDTADALAAFADNLASGNARELRNVDA